MKARGFNLFSVLLFILAYRAVALVLTFFQQPATQDALVLEPMTASFDKAHLLVSAEDMTVTPGAMWADLKMAKYVGDLERLAVITDKGWLGRVTDAADVMPGLELRPFEPGQRAAALAWPEE